MERKWPKIPRWEKEFFHITEKIDGTNACVQIDERGQVNAYSRTRLLSVAKDNFGFAGWVCEHADALRYLGEGWHFGEWWGKGIQRGYGLDHRKFSLFEPWKCRTIPDCVNVVPAFAACNIDVVLDLLYKHGSMAAPGWREFEGIILQSSLYSNVRYKIIVEHVDNDTFK